MPSYPAVYNLNYVTGNGASSGQVTFDENGVSFTGVRKTFWLKDVQVQFAIPASEIASIHPRNPNIITVKTVANKQYMFRFGTTFFSPLAPNMAGAPGPSMVPGGLVGEAVVDAAVAKKNEELLQNIVTQLETTPLQSKLGTISGPKVGRLYIIVAVIIILLIVASFVWYNHQIHQENNILNAHGIY